MPLSAGAKLGPYEIVSLLGKGGMGEVWRARDPRLNRDVAIKTSKAGFSGRFKTEAQAIAALNHPNVCTLYDVGPDYLVMELVEGPTLADRIQQGPISPEEALGIAKQIADGLEAAHEKGITHRDLKPANVKIRPDGSVKVLDFGLAKSGTEPGELSSDSPTLMSIPGTILGTAAYMSPEQARGNPVDKRSDIWSFGVVLFEMLTAKRLFDGATVSDCLAAILVKEPDLSGAPEQTRRLLRRCLEKDPNKRLRWIGDWAELLEEPRRGQPTALTEPRQRGSGFYLFSAAALALALATLSFIHFRETPPETPSLRATILPPENTTLDFTNGLGLPALSPDGKRIVFGARSADGKNPLWVRSLDGLTAQPLAGTDSAIFPFWSPDSRYIGFFADQKLKKIDASGGPAIAIANTGNARGGSWSSQGVIVFAPGNAQSDRLQRVSAAGGPVTPLPYPQGRLPWFLPDGHHFVYQTLSGGNSGFSILLVGSLDGSPTVKLSEVNSNAIYSQGHLLYLRDGTLMVRPFDVKRLALTGEEAPIAEHVQSVLNSRTSAVVSASATGLLAYRTGEDAGTVTLTWFDRSGKPGAAVGEPAIFQTASRFSPDGKKVAAGLNDNGLHIWILDVARGVRTRLTTDTAVDRSPVWSPDGRSIVFNSNRKGHYDLYRRAADGAGADELLYADDQDKVPTSWSPDGKFLLYTVLNNPKTKSDIWALPLASQKPDGPLKPVPVLQTPFNEQEAQFSRDGNWIAYGSDESGATQIYVTQFPPPVSGPGGKRQISKAGGIIPRWRQDGKEIFFQTLGGLTAAEVSIKAGAVEVGEERSLFSNTNRAIALFDVSADGQHFLIPSRPEGKSAEPLTLIQNWAAGLKK